MRDASTTFLAPARRPVLSVQTPAERICAEGEENPCPAKKPRRSAAGIRAKQGFSELAEKKGFEPLRPVKAYMISNHAPSTN